MIGGGLDFAILGGGCEILNFFFFILLKHTFFFFFFCIFKNANQTL